MATFDNAQDIAEDQPRSLIESQIKVPSLNIFLGSTPAYSALEVMSQLIYLPEQDRRRVALVFLDIDSPPAEVTQFRKAHPGVLKEFDLKISIAHGIAYADPLDPPIVQHTYIPNKTPEAFDNGAGGIRNNGHVAACTDRAKIEQLVDTALASLGALESHQNATPVTEIQINIVSFLGGGTGSGVLPDIAVMARHRALQLNLKHRMNIFCLLPERIAEAESNDISWRKSNGTATLLELIALSIARSQPDASGHRGPYTKYLMKTPYTLRGDTIANEVYLFGQTSMTSAQHAARIIGLDIFMRITNASGVGFLERSKAVDRKTLGNYDGNGLPTMFGTTCPLEVAFPAVDTATAFAQLCAAEVLPYLRGDMSSTTFELNSDEMGRAAEWEHALEPPPLPPFKDEQIQSAGRAKLDGYEARLREQIEMVTNKVREEAEALEAAELREISSIRKESLGEQLRRLESRQRIYTAALHALRDQNAPRRLQLDHVLWRQMLQAWPIMGRRDHAVAAVTDDFNRVQKRNVKAAVYDERRQLLQRLLKYVDDELARTSQYRRRLDSTDVTRQLTTAALASSAWRGELDDMHVHRRHIFDLPLLKGMKNPDGSSPPVQKLYEQLSASVTSADHAHNFSAWLDARYHDQSGLMVIDPEALRDRLVQFLRDEVYLPQLYRMNLFDLVRNCCVNEDEREDAKVEDVLYTHLQHIGGLARKLVAFEDQLWTSGTTNLSTSLYLGMQWRDGAQQRILERARNRIGTVASQGSAPMLSKALDPHRMQLAYGQHGISLGTIPDYFQGVNSSMGEFQLHEQAWMGDAIHPYGSTNAPVFSCGEMERLVMSGQALGDPLGRNLPQRVIRQIHSGAGNRPGWMGGADPAGLVGSANGVAGTHGAYGANGSGPAAGTIYNDPATGLPANGGRQPTYGRNPSHPPDVQ
jgi:hypothetical protein